MKGLLAYNYMDIDACVLHEVKKKNFLGFINGKILRIIYIYIYKLEKFTLCWEVFEFQPAGAEIPC